MRCSCAKEIKFVRIEYYYKIGVAINEAIKIMAKIDEVIAAHSAWPIK